MVIITRRIFLVAAVIVLFQGAHAFAQVTYKLVIGTHPRDPSWTGLAVTNVGINDIELTSIRLNGRDDCIFKPVAAMRAGLELQQLVARNSDRPGATPHSKEWASLTDWGLVIPNVGFESGSVMLDVNFIAKLRSRLNFSDKIALDYEDKITLRPNARVALFGSCGEITAAVATTNIGDLTVRF